MGDSAECLGWGWQWPSWMWKLKRGVVTEEKARTILHSCRTGETSASLAPCSARGEIASCFPASFPQLKMPVARLWSELEQERPMKALAPRRPQKHPRSGSQKAVSFIVGQLDGRLLLPSPPVVLILQPGPPARWGFCTQGSGSAGRPACRRTPPRTQPGCHPHPEPAAPASRAQTH